MRLLRTAPSDLKSGISIAAFMTALTVSAPSLAQAPAEPVAEDSASEEGATYDNAPIIVTGTRISRPDEALSNPVTSYSEEDIEYSGEIDLAELLSQSPALISSQTNFESTSGRSTFGGSGRELLNLRNLGSDRTLVLVNGRRHVGSLAGVSSVDVNSIPNSLVERVDILTGGISAIYGADGVSGVVNFITKRDFEGIEFTAQQGISDESDAPSTLLSGAVGSNFADGRGNIALAYDYRYQDSLAFTDRDFNSTRLVSNPGAGPDFVLASDVRYFGSSPNGAVFITPDFFINPTAAPDFDGDGSVFDPGSGLLGLYPGGTPVTIGGSGTSLDDYAGDLQPQNDAHIVNLLGHFDIAPDVTMFAEFKYARNESRSDGSASFTDPPIFIAAEESPFLPFPTGNNPFLPANIRAALTPNNFGPITGVFIARDNVDFGRYVEDTTRDTYRGIIGLEGDLADDIRYELSYVYGRNDSKVGNENYLITDRYFAALEAVDEGEYLTGTPNGNILCLSELEPTAPINILNYGGAAVTFTPGSGQCQPLNLFGRGSPSSAALDFVLADIVNESRLQQHVVNGYVTGDLGDTLRLPGGPIAFAVGAEYREEKARFDPDPLARQNIFEDFGTLNPLRGRFDTVELFGEASLPILADVPFARRLSIEAAVRYADYSNVGSTTSWKLGGIYSPIRDISFRANYSLAVRAPNISELYAAPISTVADLSDPCATANRNSGTSSRATNCVELLNRLGVPAATFNPATGLVSGFVEGNDDLTEEEARTWTLGMVLKPEFLPGLALSFDWYDIRIENAVNEAFPQQFVNLCVDQSSLDDAICSNITRDANGVITGFAASPQNVAAFETAGLDMAISYSFAPDGWGAFNVRGSVGYLDKLTFQASEGADIENRRGVLDRTTGASRPKWVATGDVTWRMDNLILNYGLNYVGDQSYFTRAELAANPNIASDDVIKVDAGLTHDFRAELVTDGGMAFFLGANNFTDEKPDAPLVNTPVGYMGRYFFAGVRATFDDFGF